MLDKIENNISQKVGLGFFLTVVIGFLGLVLSQPYITQYKFAFMGFFIALSLLLHHLNHLGPKQRSAHRVAQRGACTESPCHCKAGPQRRPLSLQIPFECARVVNKSVLEPDLLSCISESEYSTKSRTARADLTIQRRCPALSNQHPVNLSKSPSFRCNRV